MKLVFLAGGKGTRLGLTDRPKPMVEILGCPLIERSLLACKASGITDFIFLNGHMADVIEQYFGDGARHGVAIDHITEPQPLGTAGALSLLKGRMTDPFFVAYGDILFNVDLKRYEDWAAAKNGLAALLVHPNNHPYDSDLVYADDDDRIRQIYTKPHSSELMSRNIVNAGLYRFEPAILAEINPGLKFDLDRQLLPAILAKGARLYAYKSSEYAKDMGTPDRLTQGADDILSGRYDKMRASHKRSAVLLDRDGVLNVEIDGVTTPKDIELLPGASSAVAALNKSGLVVGVVTNQPIIAKGRITTSELDTIHAMLEMKLAKEAGAYVDDIVYCPHHPARGWPGEVPELKIDCDCRKPKPGLLFAIAERHNLNLSSSWMIGDRLSDIAAGHAAGTQTILVRSNAVTIDPAEIEHIKPHYTVSSLLEAVNLILSNIRVVNGENTCHQLSNIK